MEGGGGGRFRNLRDISVVMGIVKLGTECDAWIGKFGKNAKLVKKGGRGG